MGIKKILLNIKPKYKNGIKSDSWIRNLCAKIIFHRHFENLVVSIIILNTLVLTVHWSTIPDNFSKAV